MVDKIVIKGACEHNLKCIDVDIPRDQLVVITGVSGSGKSSLVLDTLQKALAQRLYRSRERSGPVRAIEGLE